MNAVIESRVIASAQYRRGYDDGYRAGTAVTMRDMREIVKRRVEGACAWGTAVGAGLGIVIAWGLL